MTTPPPLPEPAYKTNFGAGLSAYSVGQMSEYAAAVVAAERERCATLCEDRAIHQNGPRVVTLEMNQMAQAIRGKHDFRA